MVGGKSLGCKTCKLRKIKCDEQQPICTPCKKGCRYCPGALTPFIYETEMTRFEDEEEHEHTFRVVASKLRWRPTVKIGVRPPALEHATGFANNDATKTSLLYSGIGQSEAQRLSAKAGKVLVDSARTGFDLMFLGEYLPDILIRLGANPALDAAVEATLHCHQVVVHKQASDRTAYSLSYLRALQALNAQIDNSHKDISVETICAALLLCTLEIVDSSNVNQPWLSHAGGSAALFQFLGSHRFKNRFGRSLLYFHSLLSIGSSIMSGTECWLQSSDWCLILREDCAGFGESERLQGKLSAVYARLPALLLDMDADAAAPHDLLVRASNIRHSLLQLTPAVEVITDHSNLITEMPSREFDSPYKSYYQFSNLLYIQPVLFYWRLMIIADNLVYKLLMTVGQDCSALKELRASTAMAAHHIGLSAEDGRRWMPIGTLYYAINLPVAIWAYRFSSLLERTSKHEALWMLKLWNEFLEPMDWSMRRLVMEYLDNVGLDGAAVNELLGSDGHDPWLYQFV